MSGGGMQVEVRGILFDKDGTLVDFFGTWMPAYRVAMDLIAASYPDPGLCDRLWRLGGYDPDRDELDPVSLLASGTTLEICELWAEAANAADRQALIDKLHRAMDDHAARFPVPVGEGIDALFDRLTRRGLKLGVATMDSEAVARATAEALAVQDHLSFLAGYDSGHGGKPGPGMVGGFCAATGLAPAEIMVVGDTDRDMKMARSAGAAMAVGVLTGATPKERLEADADRIIGSILDIESLLTR